MQDRVLKLANSLCHDRIDVKIDVWDLKEGHNTYTFVEQCVCDPTIDKVLIICDKTYVEKANSMKDGVGSENQIISVEV